MLHVHAYEGHDHPDHHHGPAAHSHDALIDHADHTATAPADQGSVRLGSCDPSEHVVPFAFTCVSPTVHHVLGVGTAVPAVLAPNVLRCCRILPRDVRAHSPPRLTDAPLRAPPVVHPA
jgi:hypothetical protein